MAPSSSLPSSHDVTSPLLLALRDKRVKAAVIDFDHYRIRGGMAVETDYIIQVEPTSAPKSKKEPQIESFTLSKSYSAFRTLGHQLKKAADDVMSTKDLPPKPVQKLAQYCETVVHLVEAERQQYLGKVNYNYVKALAKKRSAIINECLDVTLNHFPTDLSIHRFQKEVANIIETFFLLDHCIMDTSVVDDSSASGGTQPHHHHRGSSLSSIADNIFKTPKKYRNAGSSFGSNSGGPPAATTAGTSSSNLERTIENVIENVGQHLKEIFPSEQQQHHQNKDSNNNKNGSKKAVPTTPSSNATRELKIDTGAGKPKNNSRILTSPVVPLTRKSRRSISCREHDENELTTVGEDANLLLDDDRLPTEFVPSYSHPVPTFRSRGKKLGNILENNPIVFALIGGAVVYFLKDASNLTVTIDLDIMLLLVWASFCVGLHTPRPMVGGIDKSTRPVVSRRASTPKDRRALFRKMDRSGRALLRMSMILSPEPLHSTRSVSSASSKLSFGQIKEEGEFEDEESVLDDGMEDSRSPLPQFPEGAEFGTILNCWSQPHLENFKVRGPKYLTDHVKIKSGPFMFPLRACDLFLTDTCPQNAGSIAGVLGGELRDKPTFIINFRLPWGIFLAYWEIPERFIPFVRAGHEKGFDKSTIPSLDSLSNQDRCVARFLMGSHQHKNDVLKIVPMVVDGPWVVKSVVTGKPALIGTKMPVSYFYSKAENGKELYLEADLDIVASSAARGILSMVRSYTQILTIDLGFVVQGNKNDELPEQMLVGCRLHGIDPLSAPPLPPSKDMFMHHTQSSDESDASE